jgi:hypothetical protein
MYSKLTVYLCSTVFFYVLSIYLCFYLSTRIYLSSLLCSTVVRSGHQLKNGSHEERQNFARRAPVAPLPLLSRMLLSLLARSLLTRSHLHTSHLHTPYLHALTYTLPTCTLPTYTLPTYLHTPYLLHAPYLRALLDSAIRTISGKASRFHKRDKYSDLRGYIR